MQSRQSEGTKMNKLGLRELGTTAVLLCAARIGGLVERIKRDERGDVPGWVMITLVNRA